MSEIICRSISNGREFEISNDYFRSLHALRSECNSYIPAEARYTELLTEHDKQIRAEAIEEVIKLYKEFQPKLATNVYEFGERLRQMQKGAENE